MDRIIHKMGMYHLVVWANIDENVIGLNGGVCDTQSPYVSDRRGFMILFINKRHLVTSFYETIFGAWPVRDRLCSYKCDQSRTLSSRFRSNEGRK